MIRAPSAAKVVFLDAAEALRAPTTPQLLACCDSVVAVLDAAQTEAWMARFDALAQAPDAGHGSGLFTATHVFDIEGQALVVVSDGGDEIATGAFAQWCAEAGVRSQEIIDGLDCTGVAPEAIYTGTGGGDDLALLALVHRLYN